MELFRLLGTVAVNTQDANNNIAQTTTRAGELSEALAGAAEKAASFCSKILATTGAAATALGGMAINASSEMESALDSFAAATGTAAEELADYEETLKNIYSGNYGESFEDVANSMAQIKQQMGDIGAEKLEEITADAILLRDVFEFEVNESTRAAKMLMDQFGISSKEAYNLIAQGAENGLDKNGDLLDSINEYSVHYKQMGYTAEQFFNSLKNGSEAGTFSVDKLGDAMKEFGIRMKDTSDTTTDALNLLGYGTTKETREAIRKTNEQIAKLEDKLISAKQKQSELNLKASELSKTNSEKYNKKIETLNGNIANLEKQLTYAKAEQSKFNDKTSELTKMKSADKIAEYTKKLEAAKAELADLTTNQASFNDKSAELSKANNAQDIARYSSELEELKEKLAILNDEASNTTGTVDELQTKFAAGGEEAQEATAEVLEALFAIDDEVKRNSVGVSLFGSMWEDLGAEGIKALTEVEGGINIATDALSVMGETVDDNLSAKMDGLKRKLETSVVVPLGQKLEPIAKRLIQTVEKKMPQIQKMAEKLGEVIERGFDKLEPVIEWLIDDALPVLVDILGFCIDNFETLAGVVTTAYGAFKIFNAVLAGNPIGAVVQGVGLLAGGIAILADSFETQEEKEARARKEMEEYIEKSGEARRAAQERREEIDRLTEKELAETQITKDLWAELQTLVDENGKVLAGNEDRAAFITDELEEALGIEISLVDGQIQKYQELQEEINKTLKAKEASIYLGASEQKYQDALTNRDATEDKLSAYKQSMDKAWKDVQPMNDEYKARKEAINAITNSQDKADAETKFGEWYNKYYKPLADAYTKARADYENTLQELEGYSAAIAQYENAYALYAKGEYDATIEYLDKITEARITAAEIAKGLSAQQLEELKRQVIESGVQYEEYLRMLENCSEDEKEYYEREVEKKKKRFEEDQKLYRDAGGKNADEISRAIISQMQAYDHEFTSLGSEAVKSIEKGFGTGTKGFRSLVQSSLDESVTGLKYNAFTTIGEQMVAGITSGMTNKYSASLLDGASSKVVDDMLIGCKREAGIKSPARRFAEEVGAYIPSGIAMGVEDNEDDAVESVNNIVGLMTSGQVKPTDYVANISTSDESVVTGKLDQLIQLMSAFTQQRIYLNGDVLVGELAPAMNMELGQIGIMTERGQ